MRKAIIGAITAASAVGLVVGCGSSGDHESTLIPAHGALPAHYAPTTVHGLVRAVPGTNNNVYNVGPFKVSLIAHFTRAVPWPGGSAAHRPSESGSRTRPRISSVWFSQRSSSFQVTRSRVKWWTLNKPSTTTAARLGAFHFTPASLRSSYAFPNLPSNTTAKSYFTFALTQVSYWSSIGPEHDINVNLNTGG